MFCFSICQRVNFKHPFGTDAIPELACFGGENTSVNKEITMAHVISDDCVKCGACKETCPCEAISEGDTKLVVDPDKCVDCGACEAACPTGAIKAAE